MPPFENLFTKAFENLVEMSLCPDGYDILKLREEDMSTTNRSIISNEIEVPAKSIPKKENKTKQIWVDSEPIL